MPIIKDTKLLLESTFDIPFCVERDYKASSIKMIISPQNDCNQLFSIVVTFINDIRMEMEFIPQIYAAQMVSEMGVASNNKNFFTFHKRRCTHQIIRRSQERITSLNRVFRQLRVSTVL